MARHPSSRRTVPARLALARRRLLPTLLALPLAAGAAAAQDQTLVGDDRKEFGGFGGPLFRVTTVAGETMPMAGGAGAFLLNRRFAIGGAGFGGTRAVDTRTLGRGEMDLAYGGLTFEYVTRPSRLVHATVGLLVGGGEVSVWPDDLRPRTGRRGPADRVDEFAVVEPQVGAVVNVTRWFRAGVGLGYRAALGGDAPRELLDDQLSGLSGTLVFRFGRF
jgi:hypothetical protein